MSRYLIGIDLGTTNSALAYIDLEGQSRHGRHRHPTFRVPQLVAPGEVADRPLLAVVPLSARPARPAAGATALPWDAKPQLRRRRVRPQPRGDGSRPAGHLGQVVAVSRRRRSHRAAACPGARRPTCRASRRSRRPPATCATSSRPGTTRWPRTSRATGSRSRRSC